MPRHAHTFAIALAIVLSALQPFSLSALRGVAAPAPTPPMGWNSFDSYGVYLHEDAARANLEAMAEKLKPHGYEYFVIDNGWFGEYKLIPGTRYSAEKHASRLNLDEHGYYLPSKTYFPHGFAPLIQRAHELGLKFGVHLMRGIPRQAVEQNLPIEGTPYHARDIADTTPAHQCKWCPYNYAVDMTKPGAQAWYDGLIRHLAAQGIDFIKYDDIVPWPAEVAAVATAIAKVDRPIVLSLSPGGKVDPDAIDTFRKANALRVTEDIWDDQKSLDRCFAAWRKWTGHERPNFWIDMDMIPFGDLQLMTPPAATTAANTAATAALAGKGAHRHSQLTPDQMLTFITLRALSASPLIMGGDLPTLDDYSLRLITDPDVLACNQNGIMGRLVSDSGDGLEVWFTPEKAAPARGWFGIFNRTATARDIALTPAQLALKPDAAPTLTDIWNDRRALPVRAENPVTTTIPANGVLFLRLQSPPPTAGLKRANIEYATAAGESLKLDIAIPAGAGPFPAVIYVHGGGWTRGDKSTGGAALFAPLEKAGIARFSINYRLAPAHKYPASSDDLDTAIRWVKTHAADYNIDPARLALVGDSAGGHLVALAATRALDNAAPDDTPARQRPIVSSETTGPTNRVQGEAKSLTSKIENPDTRVAAIVPFYAPTDLLRLFFPIAGRMAPQAVAYFGITDYSAESRALLREASPSAHVRAGLPPFLLVHGDSDRLVPVAQSIEFQKLLRAAGVPCDLIIVKGGAHGMRTWSPLDSDYAARVIAWLQKNLCLNAKA